MGKLIIGIVLVIGGIAFGVYMGLWVCFIGGIVDIIEQIKSPAEINALTVAWGIAKILLTGVVGWLSALVLILPGLYFIKNA